MNPCNNCIVDMICIKECPMFKIDLERLQTDEMIYLKRCMNNIVHTFHISFNVTVKIRRLGIYWHKNGKNHRDNDQPASITVGGSYHWVKNGKLHRDNDKPASIWNDGTRFWYRNGYLHRGDGKPAIIRFDRTKEFWKDGEQYEPL